MENITQVKTKRDNSENVEYRTDGYPVYIRIGYLSRYPNFSAISHWHDDMEFILVLSGHMIYNVNGEMIRMEEGDGIFVNTRQLHYGFSDDQSECVFLCLIIHPVILCASDRIEQKYIRPVMENRLMPYVHLHADAEHEDVILHSIRRIYEYTNHSHQELMIQSVLYQLWNSLYQLVGSQQGGMMPRNHHLTILKDMISFLQAHYPEKITLGEISDAGNVGKTTCCVIFQKYVNQTPIAYLTDYRLQNGVELLLKTDMTITEISYAVGFSGASYFAETFRKIYHCTPTEYKQHGGEAANHKQDSGESNDQSEK